MPAVFPLSYFDTCVRRDLKELHTVIHTTTLGICADSGSWNKVADSSDRNMVIESLWFWLFSYVLSEKAQICIKFFFLDQSPARRGLYPRLWICIKALLPFFLPFSLQVFFIRHVNITLVVNPRMNCSWTTKQQEKISWSVCGDWKSRAVCP